MATSKDSIKPKFLDNQIPDQYDFDEVFDSYINKVDDKATLEMVQQGIDDESYVTPALLKSGLQNLGVITGNCYMPYKQHIDNFSDQTIYLDRLPVKNSVKVFKEGQLLLEGTRDNGDYALDYETGVIDFFIPVPNRNIEVNYWYKNLGPLPEGSQDITTIVSSFSFANANGFTGTVANPTSTPELTLDLQTASATQQGKLSSADWNTFNNKAPLNSPVFTGTPTAPSPSYYDNSNKIATTNYVNNFWANTLPLEVGGYYTDMTGNYGYSNNLYSLYNSQVHVTYVGDIATVSGYVDLEVAYSYTLTELELYVPYEDMSNGSWVPTLTGTAVQNINDPDGYSPVYGICYFPYSILLRFTPKNSGETLITFSYSYKYR